MEKSFYNEIAKLKKLIRKGWIYREVPDRLESDAEHTFSMLLMGIEIMSKNHLNLDELKVLKMIVFHELCEIDAGDVTPMEKMPPEVKFEREYACIKRRAKDYEMPEIEDIWLEFEKGQTKEAKFVKKLDKYDAVCQSKIYAEEYDMEKLFEEFRDSVPEIYDELNDLRNL